MSSATQSTTSVPLAMACFVCLSRSVTVLRPKTG
nr:MAG TPA: hypothetical protein [Caudoviricetes sp.]